TGLGVPSCAISADVRNCIQYFPRRWLTIDTPFSSRTAPRFDYFVLSTLPSMFPHLVAAFFDACVSVTLPFAMFATSGLDSVLLGVSLVDLEDCLWSQVWAHVSRGLVSVFPHSCCSLLPLLPLSFVVLHRHRRLVCACLVC
ncbi:hypothetical protein HID58_066622, partial [Brassica napus]